MSDLPIPERASAARDRSSAVEATTSPGEDQDNRGWSPRFVLSLISLGLVIELLSISYIMAATAVPEIMGRFETTQGAWVTTAFLLAGAVACPILGKLADMYGKRRVLLFAVAGAGVGAVIAALAPSFGWLLVGRALQGLLGPAMPLTYSLMRDVYPRRILPMAVSIATAGLGIALIPAPWLTGHLLDSYGFRGIFWFFAVILAVAVVAIRMTTEESPLRSQAQRMDYLGALLIASGLVGVLVGVSFGSEWGWSAGRTLAFIGGGIVLLALWAVSALRVAEPLIDLRFFAGRSVGLTTLSYALSSGAIGGFATILPILVMMPAEAGLGYGFGTSATGYALFQTPWSITTVLAGVAVGVLISRVGARRILIWAAIPLAIAAIGTGLMHDSKGVLVVWALLFGLGQGLLYSGVANAVIEAVPAALQGAMSGMVQVAGLLTGAIIPVVLFAIMNAQGSTLAGGAVLYHEEGLTTSFLVVGAVAVLGAITALALPRLVRRQDKVSAPVAPAVQVAEV